MDNYLVPYSAIESTYSLPISRTDDVLSNVWSLSTWVSGPSRAPYSQGQLMLFSLSRDDTGELSFADSFGLLVTHGHSFSEVVANWSSGARVALKGLCEASVNYDESWLVGRLFDVVGGDLYESYIQEEDEEDQEANIALAALASAEAPQDD